MAYTNDVNSIANNIRTIQRNANVLLNASEDIGLEVNGKKFGV